MASVGGKYSVVRNSVFPYWFLLVFLCILPNPVQAQGTPENQDENLPALLRLDKVVRPVTFKDTRGEEWALDAQQDAKAIVIVFLNFKCPIANRYTADLVTWSEKYKSRGVQFIGVVCNEESPDELDRHVKEFKLYFKIFHDPSHIIANHFLADITPQCFLLDGDKVLRYFGAIDDQYQDRTTRMMRAKNNYLLTALDQVVAGEMVAVKSAQAIGCPITRAKKEIVLDGEVTFYRDVLPLLQSHCQRCHHPGDVAPFQLLTFEDALGWADDIKDYVTNRKMPPWPIRGGLPLKNDRGLNENQIATFSRWVEAGCPKGNAKDAPQPVVFPVKKDWENDNPPDIILEMPAAFHLAAKGEDHYRMIAFPLNNKEELNIQQVQFVPGNKRIVHHELTFYDGTGMVEDAQKRLGKGKPIGSNDQDYGPGYESGMGLGFPLKSIRLEHRNEKNPGGALGVWVPGQGKMAFPPKAVSVVPPESSILMQIHYHRTGKPEEDISKIGIWLSKEKPEKYVNYMLVDTSFRMIPKGVARFKSVGSRVVAQDCEAYLFKPHMHFAGREMRVWHQPKNSRERNLLFDLRGWDYNWQTSYYLKEFYPLEKGSMLHVEAIFDNSIQNPDNRFNPPRMLFLGENDEDEMGYCSVSYMAPQRPSGHNEFIDYFIKLKEGGMLKRAYQSAK